jgi:glycosyltransferase involved in cell wall biosynthesis
VIKINKTILYVGRVHPEKGIELLLAAFQQLAQAGIDKIGN